LDTFSSWTPGPAELVNGYPIVALSCSAGGLDALIGVLGPLPVFRADRRGLRADRDAVWAWLAEVLQRILLVAQQQPAQDGKERGEDQPGVEDDEAAGLSHVPAFRGARSWSRGTEISIRGRSNEVTADQGTISERRAR